MYSSPSSSPLVPLQSPLLTAAGFRHGFYTRHGGCSVGNYASLNTSPTVGDAAPLVQENLSRIATSLAIRPAQLCIPSQVHGCEIVRLTDTDRGVDIANRKADALISNSTGPACAVRTADCVPVLLADPDRGTVAAIHAGWRGVEQQIVPATLEAMVARGSRTSELLVAIGPHISVRAFEVGEEVAERLRRASSDSEIVEYKGHQDLPKGSSEARPHIDLLKILLAQLKHCGLLPTQIDSVAGCTFSEPSRFFSYRRDGAKSGRMLSVIVPRNDRL